MTASITKKNIAKKLSNVKTMLKPFEHSLLKVYYKNNHLPLSLKFVKNANKQTLTVLIKAYGILINPVWVKVCVIDYEVSQGKYIATSAYHNKEVINDDEEITITNYLNLPASKDAPIQSNSSDELESSYHE